MGAVQKLATVVMIGLVAMATVFLVYAANEPNRRGDQTGFQEDLAIERGTELYITYCLQCHAPDGKGMAEGTGRIGGVLNQEGMDTSGAPIVYQSDDASMQQKAEAFIRYRIQNGAPGDPRLPTLMPAFGNDLNVEQVNDLVYLLMHGDWNYVYNTAMEETGKTYQTNTCATDPSNEICGEHEVYAYPTVPPTAAPEAEASPVAGATPAASTESGDTAAAPSVEIDAQDVKWSTNEATVKPGDTITVKNTGVLQHDFVIDELGIKLELAGGESGTVTIPADAKPGTYTYYCSVPGHKESGMTGTLTVQ